jgi:hypothetical protein
MALLVQVAATRQLGFSKLRELFVNCHTPVEVHDWIVKALETETTRAPIVELLETIDHLARVSPDPVTFGAIQVQLREQRAINVRVTQIREWVQSIWSLAPGYISMVEDSVALETSVSKVLDVVRQHGGMMPDNVIKDSFLAPLLNPPPN